MDKARKKGITAATATVTLIPAYIAFAAYVSITVPYSDKWKIYDAGDRFGVFAMFFLVPVLVGLVGLVLFIAGVGLFSLWQNLEHKYTRYFYRKEGHEIDA